MNVSGIISKIKHNADKLALAYGYLGCYYKEYGNFEDMLYHVFQGITNPTLSPTEIIDRLKGGRHGEFFRQGLVAYIAGEVIGSFEGINLKEIGKNIMIGSAGAAIFWGGGHSSTGSVGGNSPSWGYKA